MAKQRGGARSLNDHYAANDYYCENERVVGVWWGRGAEQLGVAGRAIGEKDAAFSALFQEQDAGRREAEATGVGNHWV